MYCTHLWTCKKFTHSTLWKQKDIDAAMQTFLAPLLHTWKIAIQSVTYLWIGDRVSKYPSLGWCAVCRLGNNIIIPDTSASNGTTSIKTVALTSLDSGFQQSDTTTTPNRRVTCLMSAAWYARTSAGRMEQVLQRPVRPDTQGAPRRNRRVTRLMSAAWYARTSAGRIEQVLQRPFITTAQTLGEPPGETAESPVWCPLPGMLRTSAGRIEQVLQRPFITTAQTLREPPGETAESPIWCPLSDMLR